jgi:hypothetical protein
MAWYNTSVTQGYKWTWNNTKAHSGIDLAEVNGTPLTSAVSGVVLSAGVHDWGGQVSIRFTVADQDMTLSYLHMSDIAQGIVPGVQVQAGQYIGKSGGATWSRPYATGTKYSSGPHLHFELWAGDRAPYVEQSPWRPDDAHHPVDPTNMFYALKAHGIPNDQSALASSIAGGGAASGSSGGQGPTSPPTGGQRAHTILQDAPGFGGITRAIDSAEQLNPWSPPSASVPANVGDIQVGIGGTSVNVHVPGASDLAAAAARSQSAASTASYTVSWIVNNITPLAFRWMLVLMGLILIAALLYAQVRRSEIVQTLAPNPEQAVQALAMAGSAGAL